MTFINLYVILLLVITTLIITLDYVNCKGFQFIFIILFVKSFNYLN